MRIIFNALNIFLRKLFLPPQKIDDVRKHPSKIILPKISFETIEVVNKVPDNDLIDDKRFIQVVYKGIPRWSLFKCPCGCGVIISLPLQKPHIPKWTVTKSESGRATLKPSVWQNKGCMSHFWITDGRVFWCTNTGKNPNMEFPEIYPKRK